MEYVWRLDMVVPVQMSMSIPCACPLGPGCAVADDFDRRQRISAHKCRDRTHRFVRRSDATHRRVRRTGQVARICSPGVYANAWVTSDIETDDAVRAVRSIRAGGVAMRSHPILDQIGSIGQVRQCSVAVDIVVGCPRPLGFAIVSDQRYLMGLPVEDKSGHKVGGRKEVPWHGTLNVLLRCVLAVDSKQMFDDELPENRRVVIGYDNAHGYPHRHYMGKIMPEPD